MKNFRRSLEHVHMAFLIDRILDLARMMLGLLEVCMMIFEAVTIAVALVV